MDFDTTLRDVGPYRFLTKFNGDEYNFAPGVWGYALHLGGTHDWGEVYIDDRVSITNGATMELWFREAPGAGAMIRTLAVFAGMSLVIDSPRPAGSLRGEIF